MSKLLSDEELDAALAILEDRGPGVHWALIDKMTGAIRAHIDALTDEIADRDGAIERITEDLNEAHRERLRDHEQAATVQADLLARVGELIAQRDRARDIAVALEQELAEFEAAAKADRHETWPA